LEPELQSAKEVKDLTLPPAAAEEENSIDFSDVRQLQSQRAAWPAGVASCAGKDNFLLPASLEHAHGVTQRYAGEKGRGVRSLGLVMHFV